MTTDEPQLVTFEALFEVSPPGTPATPRPPGRPREVLGTAGREGVLVSFDPTEGDAAFARELADRVLEYVKTRQAGMSPEQLATLIQQFLTLRSA